MPKTTDYPLLALPDLSDIMEVIDDPSGTPTNKKSTLESIAQAMGSGPSSQFMLTANGSAIGPAINDYFGSTSAFPTTAGAVYFLQYYLWYLKTTAGTVTYTLTNTAAYTNVVASYEQSAAAGVTPAGSGQDAGFVTTTTAAAALPATASLTNGANHMARIYALAEIGTAGNIRLRVTSSAGSVTPLRGSFYIARRFVPVGSFVA